MSRLSLAVLALLGLPVLAHAHAHLASAIPAEGGIVPPPPAVTLDFTQAVDPARSAIELRAPDGTRMDDGAPHATSGAPARLSVWAKALPPGDYSVSWMATALDGHRSEGRFTFTVAK